MGTFLSDVVLQVLSFVAENERHVIHQRQMEGIAAARERGVQFGRPAKPLPEGFDKVMRSWKAREITAKEAATLCCMSRSTFFYKIKDLREEFEKEGSNLPEHYLHIISGTVTNHKDSALVPSSTFTQ